MTRLSCGLFKFAVVVVCLLVTAQVSADRRRNNNRNNNRNNQARNQQRQLINRSIQAHKNATENAKAVGAAAAQHAENAAYEAQKALQEIETAKAHIATLENAAEAAVDNLKQIEQSIIEAQADDSRLTRALAYVAESEAEYATVRQKLFNSPSYKAAYQRALASPNKARELPAVRRAFIDDSSELQTASIQLDTARKQLEIVRSEVLGSDDDWVAAVNEVRSTKEALASSKLALKNALLGKGAAASVYRNHAATAAAAAERIQRSEASIKSLEAQQKRIQQQQQRNNRNNRSRNRRR